jgi:hypothetical protein
MTHRYRDPRKLESPPPPHQRKGCMRCSRIGKATDTRHSRSLDPNTMEGAMNRAALACVIQRGSTGQTGCTSSASTLLFAISLTNWTHIGPRKTPRFFLQQPSGTFTHPRNENISQQTARTVTPSPHPNFRLFNDASSNSDYTMTPWLNWKHAAGSGNGLPYGIRTTYASTNWVEPRNRRFAGWQSSQKRHECEADRYSSSKVSREVLSSCLITSNRHSRVHVWLNMTYSTVHVWLNLRDTAQPIFNNTLRIFHRRNP